MKNSIRNFTTVALLAAVSALHGADDKKTAAKEEKGELRVITSTGGERRVMINRSNEKEKVTFLGVETSPVSNTVAAQLGLPKGSGLVVNHVVPNSAATGVLEENDILLRLDDQILIETRQLAVLIRNRKEGEEVTLTFMRGGKQTSAKVKLGQKEVPKMSTIFEQRIPLGGGGFSFGSGSGSSSGSFQLHSNAPGEKREEVDRVLSLIQPTPGQDPVRIHIERQGQGFRAMSVNTDNSNLVYSDNDGSLELTTKDGKKSLVAKNAKGEELCNGAVNTPEERKALPEAVRERLEKLEGMHGITFHTDRDFVGGEGKVLQPRPRGISLPMQPASRRRGPTYF